MMFLSLQIIHDNKCSLWLWLSDDIIYAFIFLLSLQGLLKNKSINFRIKTSLSMFAFNLNVYRKKK